jgi:BASS family bile acid:Na+ symporter
MTIERLLNLLVTVTLIEMMVAVGLGVAVADLGRVAKDARLLMRASIINYLMVPAGTVALLLLFQAPPMVSGGFLILAVCPGAPFGPPCTKIAKGNVGASVGLMIFLAASSAVVAPLLLQLLLPLLAGSQSLHIDAVKLVGTLLATQLVPFCAGLALRHWRPALAVWLQRPANQLSAFLNLTVVVFILATQFRMLAAIPVRAYVGMSILFIGSVTAGWLLGFPGRDDRKAMALTTSLRNVGVALVIATASFSGTAAVTATLAYGLLEIFGSVLLAALWGQAVSQRSTRFESEKSFVGAA